MVPFRGKDIPRDSIARALKVGTLVEGNVEQAGSSVRATIRLIDAPAARSSERSSFEQSAGAYVTPGDSLAQKAAQFLRQRLGEEVRLREQRSSTKSAGSHGSCSSGPSRHGRLQRRPPPRATP